MANEPRWKPVPASQPREPRKFNWTNMISYTALILAAAGIVGLATVVVPYFLTSKRTHTRNSMNVEALDGLAGADNKGAWKTRFFIGAGVGALGAIGMLLQAKSRRDR